MDDSLVSNILRLANDYEMQIASYQFYNDQLHNLELTENEIKEKISHIMDNDELLLSMIKHNWSLVRFTREKGNDFFIKACMANPKCGKEARDLNTLIELHKINPEITKYAAPLYREKLEEYLKNNPQNEAQAFYSLDGVAHPTLEEALMKNQELQEGMNQNRNM